MSFLYRVTLENKEKEEQRVKEYLSSIEEVLKAQNATPDGLSSAEAEKRLGGGEADPLLAATEKYKDKKGTGGKQHGK